MNNHFKNAFPAFPMADKFNQPVFPQTGLSKVEFFAIEIFKTYYDPKTVVLPETLFRVCIDDALTFLTFIEKQKKEYEENNKMAIVQ